MAKRKEKTTKRITLDLSEPFYNRLDGLQDLVGADSKAGLIRDALQLYEYVAKRTAAGHGFQTVNQAGDTQTIVLLGILPPE
jgi:hypothetical protein